MIRRDYVQRLIDAARVEYYASGNDGGRTWWPWRMGKACAPEGTHHEPEKCDTFILDSNFSDESVTNEDVLNQAVDIDADAAVLADVYQDAAETVAALKDGLELAQDHAYDGTLVLPLQPPHTRCAQQLTQYTRDVDVWWAVGGVKDEPAAVKIDATRQLRSELGTHAHIHGLGFGVTPELARVIQQNPRLLDSIDNSSAIMNTQATDLTGTKEKMTVMAARATEKRLKNLRMLTPFADPETDTTQTSAAEWL